MTPQGSALINTDYFTKLTQSINATENCSELQALVDNAFASLGAVKAAISAELAKIQPLLDLLTVPGANLTAIVNWIKSFITEFLTPLTLPAMTYAAQLAALAAQIADLVSAIEAAASRITSCSVSIPSI